MSSFVTKRDMSAQDDYEQFMMGFRLGCPVEDDPPPTVPAAPTESFLRGLEAGKAAMQKHQQHREG